MGNTAIKGDKNTSGSFTPHNKKKGSPRVFKNIGWYFAVLIVVLLIIIMAVPSLGIFSKNAQGEEYVFGKFADKDIKFANGSYMAAIYNNIMQQYSQYFNAEQIASMQMQIMQQAFQSAALQTAFDYYASKYGMKVTEQETDDYIRNVYKNDKGEFNASAWKNLSASQRANIRSNVNNEIIGEKLSGLYVSSPISDGEIEALRAYKQGIREKEFEEQQEKDSREGITTEQKEKEIVNVSEQEVVSSIKDTAKERYYSSVLKSKLFEDNFAVVYTGKILPLMNRAEDNAVASEENTLNAETDMTDSTTESTETDNMQQISESTTQTENTVSHPVEPTSNAENVSQSHEATDVQSEAILSNDNVAVAQSVSVNEPEQAVKNETPSFEKINFALGNSEGGVKSIDNSVEFTLNQDS